MAYGEDNYYLEEGDEVIILDGKYKDWAATIAADRLDAQSMTVYDVKAKAAGGTILVKGLRRGDLQLIGEVKFDVVAALAEDVLAGTGATRCEACGNVYFIGEWPICNGTGDHSPGHGSHAIGKVGADPPVVYYENKQGEIRFGDYRDAGFEPKGFQRREIEAWDRKSAEKFERRINQQENDKYDQIQVREQQTFEPAVKESREQLRGKLKTEQGKVLAEQARAITEKKNKKPKFDAGFSTVFNH